MAVSIIFAGCARFSSDSGASPKPGSGMTGFDASRFEISPLPEITGAPSLPPILLPTARPYPSGAASPSPFSSPAPSPYRQEMPPVTPFQSVTAGHNGQKAPGVKSPARVPILAYHSVNDKPAGLKQLSVKEKDFEEQLCYLRDHGFTPITFGELERFTAYSRPVILTFDDGYEDNYTKAYPILKKYGCAATVFLIADSIGRQGYLTSEQILEMRDLVSFQSHTETHPSLVGLGPARLKRELLESRRRITVLTDAPVFVLSYPAGDYDDAVTGAAAGVYDWAVTMKYGYYTADSKPLQLKRLRVLRSFSMKDFADTVG